jgi:hypothetical protein
MCLIVELNAYANMFYLLKHLLLLNLVIFKLKCNNLIFNEILVLYASYVCLMHSCFIENHPNWNLEDGPLISEVVLSCQRSKLGLPTDGHQLYHQKRERERNMHTIKIQKHKA